MDAPLGRPRGFRRSSRHDIPGGGTAGGTLDSVHTMFKRIVFIALLALPVAAWAFVKPVRVLAPQLAGLTCHGEVCVDDPSRLPEATGLYENAVRYVRFSVGEFQAEPRAVFCSTKTCSRYFGFTSQNAY